MFFHLKAPCGFQSLHFSKPSCSKELCWPVTLPKPVVCQNWKSKSSAFPFSMNEAEGVFCSCQRWQMRFNLLVCYRSQNSLGWKELPEVSGPTALSRFISMLDHAAEAQLKMLIRFPYSYTQVAFSVAVLGSKKYSASSSCTVSCHATTCYLL